MHVCLWYRISFQRISKCITDANFQMWNQRKEKHEYRFRFSLILHLCVTDVSECLIPEWQDWMRVHGIIASCLYQIASCEALLNLLRFDITFLESFHNLLFQNENEFCTHLSLKFQKIMNVPEGFYRPVRTVFTSLWHFRLVVNACLSTSILTDEINILI